MMNGKIYRSNPVLYINFLFFKTAAVKNKTANPRDICDAEIEIPENNKKSNKKEYDNLIKLIFEAIFILAAVKEFQFTSLSDKFFESSKPVKSYSGIIL